MSSVENNIQARMKVLIVDDEPDICYFLSHNLTKKNFDVSCVHTLTDADIQLDKIKPSVLILDNHLADGFGINHLPKIREAYQDLKIIMITAHDSTQDRLKAIQNGADFFLSKPFAVQQVTSIIEGFGTHRQ
jgi:two-component system, OmpR family, response regulator